MQIFNDFLKERFGKDIPRNAEAINSGIKYVNSGEHKQMLSKKELWIYVPKRFEEAGLAKIEHSFRTMAYFAIVSSDGYAISSTPSFLNLSPTSVLTVKVGEDEYFELYFEPNSLVVENISCYKDSSNAYLIYNELIAKPNMCSFFDYNDALLSVSKLPLYANISLDKTNVPTEILVATTTRYSLNLDTSYRHALSKDAKANPTYLGIRNIQYGVTNLPTAVIGAYSDIGIDSLMVKPAKKVETYERLLRM